MLALLNLGQKVLCVCLWKFYGLDASAAGPGFAGKWHAGYLALFGLLSLHALLMFVCGVCACCLKCWCADVGYLCVAVSCAFCIVVLCCLHAVVPLLCLCVFVLCCSDLSVCFTLWLASCSV